MRGAGDRGQLPEPARSALRGIPKVEDPDRNEAVVNAPATVVAWFEPNALACQADAGVPLRHAEEREHTVRVDQAGLEVRRVLGLGQVIRVSAERRAIE